MRRELYTRPAKPLVIPVTRRQAPEPMEAREIAAPLILSRETECHVTPPDVAERMAALMGHPGEELTLEPSAGTGALLNALLDAGAKPANLYAVEREQSLARGLNRLGCSVYNDCFLAWSERVAGQFEFSRIIMNPPFRQIRKHMDAALSLLGGDEAQLVALVPITYEHPQAVTAEELPAGTFSTTQARTKIITICKEG